MSSKVFSHRICYLLVCLLCTMCVKAQWRIGMNVPLFATSSKLFASDFGLTIGAAKRLETKPFSVGCNFSTETYALWPDNRPLETRRALTFLPFFHWHVTELDDDFLPYLGMAWGFSYEGNRGKVHMGYQEEPVPPLRNRGSSFVVAPRIGVLLFNHLDLTFQYNYLSHERSRLMVTLCWQH